MAGSAELLRQLFATQTAGIENRLVTRFASFDRRHVFLARAVASFTANTVRELFKLKFRTAGRVVRMATKTTSYLVRCQQTTKRIV